MRKDEGLEALGTLTFLRTYSKEGKETYSDMVTRYLDFMKELYPSHQKIINGYGHALFEKLIVGSQRLSQFAGKAAFQCNTRAYNCSFVAPTEWQDFGDIAYLLMQGCGVGASVERYYVDRLPRVTLDGSYCKYVDVQDTKEAWADSFVILMKNPTTVFTYDKIRAAGMPLSSGGVASGPQVLVEAHEAIRKLLFKAIRDRDGMLSTSQVADVICHIATAVVSGGQRRSAVILLTCLDDTEMKEYKSGSWWETNIQRAKANISSVVERGNKEQLLAGIDEQLDSPYGERGIVSVSSRHVGNTGTNPCGEISLSNRSFCNLSEIIVPNCSAMEDFLFACEAASFFGTLQAGLTNFKYIHPEWTENAKRDALLGVSMTGLAQAPAYLTEQVMQMGASLVVSTNKMWAKRLGINQAKRCTSVKPSGSTSCVMACTSGIHAANFEYGVRRIRVTKNSPLAQKLIKLYNLHDSTKDKYAFVVKEAYNDKDIVLQFPCHYENAIYRKDESAVALLERTAMVYKNWILPGHNEGEETNNVSLTVAFKPEEKQAVRDWLMNNTDCYRSISTLPYDCTAYPLLPFEEMSYEEYMKYKQCFPEIDWQELGVETNAAGTSACSGGQCEITSV